MEPIKILPSSYRQFRLEPGTGFYLITNSALKGTFELGNHDAYARAEILYFDDEEFAEVLARAIEPAHVLVISPRKLVASVLGEGVGRRQVAVMPLNSTPADVETIRHFVSVLERTDPDAQEAFARHFFSAGERADSLTFSNERLGTSATLQLKDHDYEWFEQAGYLDWGGQQIVPAGEISVLPLFHGEYSVDRELALDGSIALQGIPILHSGRVDFLRDDQARLHRELDALREDPVIADVKGGVVQGLRCKSGRKNAALDTLEAMFFVDSRYRRVWEIGFGLNATLTLLPGNCGMNEVYGGDAGAVHFGLGLTPYTQYHLDIICPDTRVTTDQGDVLIGERAVRGGMKRRTSQACPCIE